MPKVDADRTKRRQAATELLRNPKFLYLLGQRIEASGVTGENQNRLVVYLACLTCALLDVVSVLIKGPTSTGKNNLLKAVLALVAAEKILTRSSFSNKALAYGADDLAGKILYLVEHRAGRDAQLFTRLLQSEGALNHEVTVAGGATRVASRVGAPVFLSTTTDEQVYADDETRFLSLRADESPELTREILKFQFSEKRKKGK
jgi:hypothetical protein